MGAKKAQLDTLLAKAEQYSQFIVNSQQAEAEPSKKKQKTGLEDAAEKMKKEKALVVQPKAMTGGTLKPYQVEGLRWLATLFENGLSGILADEMGLGKTIQVIALVAHVREKNVKGPICIAAPLATLPNWMNEFRKWTPGISALLYHGSKQHRADLRKTAMRKAHQNDDDFPVIVTSYEICILDRAALSHFKFKYLVIDEGQRVKNRDCRLVRELKKLDTENRLLLSGTPIQNTLEELWSLPNFVNPQIFDDLAVFQSWFGFRNIGQETQVDDIVDDESKDRIVSKLHEILRPFLLRRVKADVLKGVLPPKKRNRRLRGDDAAPEDVRSFDLTTPVEGHAPVLGHPLHGQGGLREQHAHESKKKCEPPVPLRRAYHTYRRIRRRGEPEDADQRLGQVPAAGSTVSTAEGGRPQGPALLADDGAPEHHRGLRALEEVGRVSDRRRRRVVGAAAAD